MFTKTRNQGNSLTLTVPSSFNIKEGVSMEPKLMTNGIFYEFVHEKDNFFDFDADILRDLTAEGYKNEAFIQEFKKRKEAVYRAFEDLIEEGKAEGQLMTQKEMEKELGL